MTDLSPAEDFDGLGTGFDDFGYETVAPASDLIAAAELGEGGMFALDLLSPTRVHALVLGRRVTDDERAIALAAVRGTVTPAWWRTAVVAGVDRWAHLPLDEGLLRADIALADWEAGAVDRARSGFEQAHDALTAWLRALHAADRRWPAALVTEALRVCRAAALARPEAARLRTASERLLLFRGAAAVIEETTRSTEDSLAVARREGLAVIDPARVPARTLAAPVTSTSDRSGLVTVRCPTFRPWPADSPMAGRIAVRVVGPRDGRLLASGPLRLSADGRELIATPGLVPPPGAVVEIHDLLAGPTRCTGSGFAAIDRLVALQEAYSLGRRAAGLRAVGLVGDAAVDDALADVRLADAAPPVAAGPPFDLPGDPGRPLLAELAAVVT